jgi:hypothetical protein
MNYRHRARKIVETTVQRTTKNVCPDRVAVKWRGQFVVTLVEEIARALRRAEFEGAHIATLTAANNAANYIEQLQKRGAHLSIDRMEALRVILADAYVPKPIK